MDRVEPPRRAWRGSAHGWLLTAGAALTAAAVLLLALLPRAPSEAEALVGWVSESRSLLVWSDELLFFAVVCFGAGARGAFRSGRTRRSIRINVGLEAFGVALVSLLVLLLVVGRLVYPVFGIELSAEVVALLVSAAFGSLHLALLGFAVAAVALTWSAGNGRGGWLVSIVGIVMGAVFAAGSFPWLTPMWWNVLVAIALAVWGAMIGLVVPFRHGPEPGAG